MGRASWRNVILALQHATVQVERTLLVLSPDYLSALFPQPEWAAALAHDPTGRQGTLLPVRVRACTPPGMLRPLFYIDPVGQSEATRAIPYIVLANTPKPDLLWRRPWQCVSKCWAPAPDTARSLNTLGALLDSQGKLAEAQPYYTRALAIWEKVLGPDHPNTVLSLNNLAELYRVQGRYAEALPCYRRA